MLAAGYYPVNLRDLAEGGLNSVPAGKRPIVLTFDGSTESQFRLLPGGAVDPDTAVGILQSFHDAHPADWPLRATFCVSPFSEVPDLGPFGSQELSAQKLGLLSRWGMEVALGLEGRGNLAKMNAEEVRSELAGAQTALRKWAPDARISSLCLADGSIPKDTSVFSGGEAGGESYTFTATAGTVMGLAPSPGSSKFDPYRIPRVQATKAELDRFLKLADQPGAYYASPGE